MAEYDLAIVGGGINGIGIARDAAGRGLRVLLVEQSDLASGTSSASTKLIHGGLRYLEHGWFSLVRQALAERGVLLRMSRGCVFFGSGGWVFSSPITSAGEKFCPPPAPSISCASQLERRSKAVI